MESAERYVPINGDRVKWGLHAQRLSQREAGRRIAARLYGAGATPKDENAVAMSILKIVQGESRRCALLLRRNLAQLLDLPVRWLSGESAQLPHTYDHVPHMAGPFTHEGQVAYQRTRAIVSIMERHGRVDGELGSKPNRRQIAEYRFWKLIDPVLERRAATDARVATVVMTCLKDLVDPSWWRLQATVPTSGWTAQDHEGILLPAHRKEAESVEESEAREALMKAFSYILKPWIAGRADLDVGKLAKIAGLEGIAAVQQALGRQAQSLRRP
jgi:hypothetical protein